MAASHSAAVRKRPGRELALSDGQGNGSAPVRDGGSTQHCFHSFWVRSLPPPPQWPKARLEGRQHKVKLIFAFLSLIPPPNFERDMGAEKCFRRPSATAPPVFREYGRFAKRSGGGSITGVNRQGRFGEC